jgi:hypothetical protein
MTTQCSYIKRSNNNRCLANAVTDSDYCFFHDPTLAERRAEARKTGGYNRRIPSRTPQDYLPVKSVNDINIILESVINHALTMPTSQTQLKLVGSLCQIALKGQELGSLEDRITSIEKRLKMRMRNDEYKKTD